MEFLEGELYKRKNSSFAPLAFVIGVHIEDTYTDLAIFWVEPKTLKMIEPGEIRINKENSHEWEHMELI